MSVKTYIKFVRNGFNSVVFKIVCVLACAVGYCLNVKFKSQLVSFFKGEILANFTLHLVPSKEVLRVGSDITTTAFLLKFRQ